MEAATGPVTVPLKARVTTAIAECSIVDWLTILYLTGLNLALYVAEPSAMRTTNLWRFGGIWLLYLAAIGFVRGFLGAPPWSRAFVFRTAQFGALLGTYLLFRDYLPVANTGTLDLELYQLDLAWFGWEPALWLDSRVTPFWTEWFAFFYYSYFYLLAAHIGPILYTRGGERTLAMFGTGMTVVACIGHTAYVLVPGFGPFKALADQFQTPLQGGLFWDLVQQTVAAGGAQKDIFPSMHTAFPTFVALFSFHHRKLLPFRYTWPVVAFIVVNIVGATMYLRWHYLIDVIAGLFLAGLAFAASVLILRFEERTRAQRGLSAVWPSWR